MEHFEKECFEIKSNRYVLQQSALPTIFPTVEKPREKQTAEETPTENRATTINSENEIQFLRACVAGLEQEIESTKIQLQVIIDNQIEEIRLLKEEVHRLEEANSKFQTDFVAFAVDDDEKVIQ